MPNPFLITDRTARAMLCLLAVLVLLGARHLRLSRRSILFGIALGFALYMLAKVVLDSLTLLHLASRLTFNRMNSVAYLSACALWLLYAVRGDKLAELPTAPSLADRSAHERNVLDVINRIVEESMRNAQKIT